MNDQIIDEAARWYAAQDNDDMDWAVFTDWLEASPRHREEYDRLALLNDAIQQQRVSIAEIILPREDRTFGRWIGLGAGGALAAALALLFVSPTVDPSGDSPLTYEAGIGQSRSVDLADGSRVVLASASRLTVTGSARDRFDLHGSAYFDIAHRPDRTLIVKAGDFAISDIGTRFAVVADGARVRVEVAEGTVSVRSHRLADEVRLAAGKQLIGDAAVGSVRLTTVAADDVGSWRLGQLRYSAVPLALVANDLGRYTGQVVTVDQDAAAREFTGVVTIGDGSKLVDTVAGIMGLKVSPTAHGKRLSLRASA